VVRKKRDKSANGGGNISVFPEGVKELAGKVQRKVSEGGQRTRKKEALLGNCCRRLRMVPLTTLMKRKRCRQSFQGGGETERRDKGQAGLGSHFQRFVFPVVTERKHYWEGERV